MNPAIAQGSDALIKSAGSVCEQVIMPACSNVQVLCVTNTINFAGDDPLNLVEMSKKAAALTREAQIAQGDERAQMLADALQLRQLEMDGWLAMRSWRTLSMEQTNGGGSEMQEAADGEMSGACMAAMGIGNIHFLRGNVKDARQWYARCDEMCPENDLELRAALQNNKQGLEKLGNVWLLHRKVHVHGLTNKPEYNGRRGCVLALFSPARWEVRLEASQKHPVLHVIVHEKNLTLLNT